MKKVILGAVLSAVVASSGFAGERGLFLGVGSGMDNGKSGTALEASGFFQAPKTGGTILLKTTSGQQKNISAEFAKNTGLSINDDFLLYAVGGLGYQTWQEKSAEDKNTGSSFARASLLGVKHISYDTVIMPKLFVEYGLSNKMDYGYGAGFVVKKDLFFKDKNTIGAFIELEAKRINTEFANKDTAKVVAGLSYLF